MGIGLRPHHSEFMEIQFLYDAIRKIIDEIYLDDIEELIDDEANRRSVNEGVEDTEDWRWDWMWDFVYESTEHEVDAS